MGGRVTGLVNAVTFLTRVPLHARAEGSSMLARSVPWFPVVGAGIGAVIAAVFVLASSILPAIVAAALAVSVGAILTGALHEDGLGDVADAFAGAWTVERRLEILKDPRLGTFGVVALSASFLLRAGAISSLDGWAAVGLIPAAHALSRATGASLMRRLPVAVEEGLGASYATSVTGLTEATTVAVGLSICAGLIGSWTIPAGLLCALVVLGMGALARAKIGGISGDVLGANQQIAEIAILLLGAAAEHEDWATLTWWAQ
jgi:adenosylcobinamide-GDP ribazoletransferase